MGEACHRTRRGILCPRLGVRGGLLLALLFSFPLLHGDESFDKTSLTLRTALHYDPTVDAPLRQLAELYRAASRLEELLGLYEAHVSQYPQDAGAALVLARLYMEAKDRRAAEFWKAAAVNHPADAALTWFHAKFLDERHDPKALDEMARAVSLETSASRRAMWYAELMKAAAAAGREELVVAQTKKFLGDGSMTPEQRLRWARQAMGFKLRHSAQLLMEGLAPESLGADSALEAGMLRAELLSAEGGRAEAAKILDGMLEKLAPDHWRRHEMLMLRFDLSDAAARDSLIKAARFEAALTDSRGIEARLFETWEHEGVTAEALPWLEAVLFKQPDRADLLLRRVRWFFIAGKNDEAKQAFEGLLKVLAPDQRVERGVELARWLRRRNQLPEAASVLESALALAPDRWDLRRELAEMDFALRRKEEAVKLFDGAWTKDLAPDARLETVQFLISKQLWSQARALLEPWLKEKAGAFDGRLLLARIFNKTGEDDRATEVLDQARALCDTQERYQAWLAASLEFAEARERSAEWIRHEAAQLEPANSGAWDETTINRWLALVADARSHREEKTAGELLAIASQKAHIPAGKKTELERLRLDLLAADSGNTAEVESGLKALMESDAAHREDYRARLALLYQHAERIDLVHSLLEQLDPAQCTELDTLRALLPVCREQALPAQALAAAERLTDLEPGERANWTQRLTLLAEAGSEERFRATVRLVQAKAPDWKLKPEVLELLDSHLLASCWREVVMQMSGDAENFAAAQRVVEEAQRAGTGPPEQMHWMDWINGFLSAKLHDRSAAENALARLATVDVQQWIVFPDGLELSAAEGKRWIKEMMASEIHSTSLRISQSGKSANPLAPWSLRWGFQLAEGRTLTRLLAPVETDAVFLIDDQRTIHAVNRRSGKLLWDSEDRSTLADPAPKTQPTIRATSFRHGYPGRSYNNGQSEIKLPLEVTTDGKRLCCLRNNVLECVDATNGSLLWRSRLADTDEAIASNVRHENRLALAGGQAIVWQPEPSVVSAYDLRAGRLLWETRVPLRAKPPAANPYGGYNGYDPAARMRSGLSIDGGRAFVFSDTAAMISLDTGAMLWRLGTADLPAFPIDLESQDNSAAPGSTPALPQQALMPMRSPLSPVGMGYPSNSRLTFSGRRPQAARAAGWAYGNSFATTLQYAYGAAVLLHGDEVWTHVANNTGFVSVMGLPRKVLQITGTLQGFAGDALISFDGSAVQAQSLRENDPARVLLNLTGDDNAAANSATASIALAGSRVYACDGTTLRIVEARSGALLFEGTVPGDLADWVKNLPRPPAATPPPGYSGNSWSPQNSRRVYLPQGTYLQDNRGGGSLCAPLGAVVDGGWIFPVSENAVACVQSRADEPAHPIQP